MTENNIGYAVVTRVQSYATKELTAEAIKFLPWECQELLRRPVVESPACAPSRSAFGALPEMPDGIVFSIYNRKFYREIPRPTGGTQVGRLHFYKDCPRVAKPMRHQSLQPMTAELVDMLGIATCAKCGERLRREMPEESAVERESVSAGR